MPKIIRKHLDYRIYMGADRSDRIRVCSRSLERCDWDYEIVDRDRRFHVARLHNTGWSMYCDGDFVFLRDPIALFTLAKQYPRIPVWCVQHDPYDAPLRKKEGEANENYECKNWSSLMIFNHADPICTGFNPDEWSMKDRHRFRWVPDDALGALPQTWNVLVGVQDYHGPVQAPDALHFTHGTPEDPHSPVTRYDRYWDMFDRADWREKTKVHLL